MASQVTLKALGLNYSPNNLALPEGSLLVANDVIVRRDNVVESRRGFKDYSEGLGPSDQPIKQLLQYKDCLLAHYTDKIAYDTTELNSSGQSIFNDFSGSYVETQTGLRIKSIIANKNLYFTTSDGIKKISARTSSDFPNTKIVNSGGVKALDLTATLDIEQGQVTGFLPVDSSVGYRVLWGYRDANDNIIYGTPSERSVVYNYLNKIIPLDFNVLLNALDNISNGLKIASISTSGNPTSITTQSDHGLSNNDIVYISGTSTSPDSTVGFFKVTVTSASMFTIPVNVTSATIQNGNVVGLITDANYYNTYHLTTTDAQTFKTNVLDLAEKIDNDILYADLNTTANNAPLTIDSLQINVGSIGQINFGVDEQLTNFFDENDYIEISGFNTEPVTSNLSLTNVAGTILNPKNPTSITYTGGNIVDGQEIVITGTNTSGSVNGTYDATVVTSNIASTSGPSIINIATSGISSASTTITTSTAHGLNPNDAFYITGTGVTNFNNGTFYVVTAATGTTLTVSSTLGGAALTPTSNSSTGKIVRQIAINTSGISSSSTTITTSYDHGLIAGDAFYISGTGVSNFDNGTYYVVSAPALNTLTVSTIKGGSAITPAANSSVGILIPEITVSTTPDLHQASEGDYINIFDSDAVKGSSNNINQGWLVTNVTSTTAFKIVPNESITTQDSGVGTVTKTTIPVNVSSVTVGTGNIAVTTGKNLKQFNSNFQITSVVDPAPAGKGYIQFIIPNNPETFTSQTPDSINDANAKIISYDYRNIVNTPDIYYATALKDLEISAIATSEQLRIIENNISRIATKLKSENPGVILSGLISQYLENYSTTLVGNAKLEITIPEQVTENNFYQVYRTRLFTADGIQTLGSLGDVPVVPDDEMRLVFEGFPTTSELIARKIEMVDNYPEDLALTNENLYTNPITGSGITQANDTPPLAKDINVFKNSVFYANTKTKQRLNPFQLIGTSNIGGINNNKITIGDENNSITYVFTSGVQQQTTITIDSTVIEDDIRNKTVELSTPINDYYLWFRYNGQDLTFVNITGYGSYTEFICPFPHNLSSGSEIFIQGLKSTVNINGAQTITITGTNTFTIPIDCGTITGLITDASAIPYVSNKKSIAVNLLSDDTNTQIATKINNTIGAEATEFSSSVSSNIVTIINIDEGICNSPVNNTTGSTLTVAVTVSGDGENSSFNLLTISSVSPASPYTTINTSTSHGLSAGDVVTITGIDQASGSPVNGIFAIVSAPTSTSFTIATPIVDGNPPVINNDDYGIVTIKSLFPKVLLAQLSSRSQSIDLTARSLVNVINNQPSSPVYAYYISGENTSPGIINLEAKNISNPEFYVLANSDGVGISFTPDISPITTINTASCITGSGTTFIFTSPTHGLINDDQIIISGSDCVPNIDGIYSVQNCTTNTFEVESLETFSTDGNYFSYSKLADTTVSSNEQKPNRVYYSKTSEPEAVPLLNYFDIGSSDKAILRIFPVRDSLFVFKEDGLYRISGEEIPFVVTLFDTSCIVSAPDSVSISNNIIYAWTVKGISNITESGVSEISRPIDTEILKLSSNRYTNFRTLTWGVGYDSDNSYTVYTNSDPTDEYATIAFRYSDLTNTWTNIKRSQNCGIIFTAKDKIYTAGSEDNIIYQERKNFDRTDYSDSDFYLTLLDGNISNAPNQPIGTRLFFTGLKDAGVQAGDIITQEQILTQYVFNSLLQKLDLDPTVGVSTISSSAGASTTITITTASPHNLNDGDYVVLSNTNSVPSLNGTYQISNAGTVGVSQTFDITSENVLVSQTSQGQVKRSYELTLQAVNGDSLRDKLVDLANYLDTDPGLVLTDYFNKINSSSGLINSNSNTDPTEIDVPSNYLVSGRYVSITEVVTGVDNGSIPSIANKNYIIDVINSTTFSIPVKVTTGGASGLQYNTEVLNMYDLKACYNAIIDNLNIDSGALFSNYSTISNLNLLEAVITDVNYYANYIDVNLPLSWTNGTVTIYKAINCELVYAPITFGDPLSLKQIYEATLMFDNKAFTKATASFNTDLKPQFIPVTFYGQGNGIFGHYSNPGFGYGFFGGLSNSAPFRTIIPRESQRCRFLTIKFDHSIGREKWALNGITLTGNMGLSSRGYR